MTAKITVLLDGWPLIYRSNSPAALHLLRVLTAHPPEVEAVVALPGEPPDWWRGGASLHVSPAPDTPRGRLDWQQRRIPGLARKLGSDLVHLTTSSPALFSAIPCLVSPSETPQEQDSPAVFSRLREAMAVGGMRRLEALLWPDDLPGPSSSVLFRLPPVAFANLPPEAGSESPYVGGESPYVGDEPPKFGGLGLPESFILYHGPHAEADLRRLLAAWSWAAQSIGANYPLLLLGLDDPARARLGVLASEMGLQDTLRSLPSLSPFSIPWLYQQCAVLFHPAPISPWGDPVRQALAFGKPVVASESPEVSALVGPAAYLAPEGAARQLGAALITVTINEEVAEQLSTLALQRAAGWQADAFRQGLLQAYRLARK